MQAAAALSCRNMSLPSSPSVDSEVYLLEPPPEQSYDTLETAVADVNRWAGEHGFGIARDQTRHDSQHQIRLLALRCSFGRRAPDTITKRTTGSRMTGCQFKALVKRTPSGLWALTVASPVHNHPATLSKLALPTHRKRTIEDVAKIASLSQSNAPPQAIFHSLISEGKPVGLKDVYNDRLRIKKQRLQGLSPVQALVQELETFKLPVINSQYVAILPLTFEHS